MGIYLWGSDLYARESFEFGTGNSIQVISDKAFRKSRDNEFKAVGNVIITHTNNSIYGEKASIRFKTGEVEVVGNVRYIGPTMTLYGTKLQYNFNTKLLSVENARVLSDNYVVLGKKLSRISENEIVGVDAEYTTCKDCPESWSIFGREVRVTVGEYIRIKHAYIKVKGVVVMYVPYVMLPIKKERETGLLFPSFDFDLEEGVKYKQPWFWAISKNKDLTMRPSMLGRRGWGNEFQFRHVPMDGLWYEVNSLQAIDRIYLPNTKVEITKDREVSGTHIFRHLSDWEHHYFSGKNINHHFYYNFSRDLDINRDLGNFANDRVQGSELGGNSFLDFRSDLLSLSIEGHYNRNQIFSETNDFDHRYVQILPEVNVTTTPFRIFQTKMAMFNNLSFEFKGDITNFKQNHYQELNKIRNATRYNMGPSLEWNFGRLGPFLGKTKAKWDYQHYRFPYEELQKSYTKRGLVYETEFSLNVEKIYGLAFEKSVPIERIALKKEKTLSIDYEGYLGRVPPAAKKASKEKYIIKRNSYRHSQQYKIKHFFLSDQKSKGNTKFNAQIDNDENRESGDGQFDPVDALRSKEFELRTGTSRNSLPLNNTIEFQWNNSFIRKSAKRKDLLMDGKSLRDNFNYQKVSYFNLSQGYDLYAQREKFENNLTRLFIDTGISIDGLSLILNEYYFYSSQEHISDLSLSKNFKLGLFSLSHIYQTDTEDTDKIIEVSGEYQITSLYKILALWKYDYEERRTQTNKYGIIYSPANDCWKLNLAYEKDLNTTNISFNFLVNFNKNSFTSFNDF